VSTAALEEPGLELHPHVLAPAGGLSPAGRLLQEQLLGF
jgi:hypothetical protein